MLLSLPVVLAVAWVAAVEAPVGPVVASPAAPAEPSAPAIKPKPAPKLAVADFVVQGDAAKELGRALGDVAASEAARVGGHQVVSMGDIAAQFGLDKSRKFLGCNDDERCMLEIAGSLDVERLIAGSATLLEGSYLLTVKLIDVRKAQTLARTIDTLRNATQAEVVDCVRRLTHEAMTGKKLDTTGTVRIEVSEEDARVALDGRDLGMSPLPGGQRVLEGPHRIIVQKRGFVSWEGTVTVAPGAAIPVRVELVPASRFQEARRVLVEVFGGVTAVSRFSTVGLPTCNDDCVGNLGGLRGGYMVSGHVGLELYLVGTIAMFQRYQHPVSVELPDKTIHADDYVDRADVTSTIGGVSVFARFFDRTPLTLRFWVGAARAGAYTEVSGTFQDAPPEYSKFLSRGNYTAFWAPVFGPEVRFGYRFSEGVMMELGVAALFMRVPKTEVNGDPAPQDLRILLPPGPAFAGGWGYSVPVTLSVTYVM